MPSPSVATILRDHVSLSSSCIDRLYLNGYVPQLQSSGQVCAFLCDHLGNQIPSPAAIRPLHDRFVQAVATLAEQQVPVCLNGHEWLKQQLGKEAIPFESLDNGFRWCADPERLQQLADALGPS